MRKKGFQSKKVIKDKTNKNHYLNEKRLSDCIKSDYDIDDLADR